MKHLKTIMGALAVLVAVSCAKTPTAGSGQVIFEVSSNQQIADMTKSNVSDYTSTLPSKNDFTITITGVTVDYSWTGKISEWDSSTQLYAGDYNVVATYGSLEEEGFDKPYFYGEKSFSVTGGQPVTVSIKVTLGNTVVKLNFSENFKKYYSDYSFTLSRDGKEIVKFLKDENKAAFVDGYKFTLSGTLTAETKTYTFEKEYTSLNERTAYAINFDLSNVGGTSITISIKEGFADTVDLKDIELND